MSPRIEDRPPWRGWATGLLRAFGDGACAVGGRVVPELEAEVPEFLRGNEHLIRGFNALGPWRRKDFFIGCNIAFGRRVFEAVGLFSPDFGRRGARYDHGDESEFVRRVRRRFEVRYVEDAGVHHAIQAHRLARRYLFARAWRGGRTSAGIDELHRTGFARNVLSVALALPVTILRSSWRPSAVPVLMRATFLCSYILEGMRLLACGRGAVSPIPSVGPAVGATSRGEPECV